MNQFSSCLEDSIKSMDFCAPQSEIKKFQKLLSQN